MRLLAIDDANGPVKTVLKQPIAAENHIEAR
jgi:hypothetical protein